MIQMLDLPPKLVDILHETVGLASEQLMQEQTLLNAYNTGAAQGEDELLACMQRITAANTEMNFARRLLQISGHPMVPAKLVN